MIGLSLSICVRDIIEEKVGIEDVECIYTSTRAQTDEEWEKVIAKYRELYWEENPNLGEQITRTLLATNKIFQPRLISLAPLASQGNWIENPDIDPIQFHYYPH